MNKSTDAPIGQTVVNAQLQRSVYREVAAGNAQRVRQTLALAADAVYRIKLARADNGVHGPIALSAVRQVLNEFAATAASNGAMKLVNGRRVWVRGAVREVRWNHVENADSDAVEMTVNGSASAITETAPRFASAETAAGNFAVRRETGVPARDASPTDVRR